MHCIMHVVVCRDVDCATVAGVAEEGATLQLESCHTEIFLAEIGVHAVATPYELPLACPVKSDPEARGAGHRSGRCERMAALCRPLPLPRRLRKPRRPRPVPRAGSGVGPAERGPWLDPSPESTRQ